MGIYKRPLSIYWWMRCPRPGQRPLRESTKIEWNAPTAEQRKRNEALALAAYHTMMGDLARERYELPARDEVEDDETLTIGEWIAWYRQHVSSKHRGHERELEILPRFETDLGAHQLNELTREDVQEWMTKRAESTWRGRPISNATINREVDVLKEVLREAAANGKITASPIAGMAKLHTPTPMRRVLSRDEERRLLEAIRQPEDRALLIMGLDTLVRLGDCLDLRRRDDHKKSLWIGDPKTGTGYRVPVTPRLRKALDAIPTSGPDQEYYFSLRRRPALQRQRRAGISHMLRRACAAAVPPVPYGQLTGGIAWHWATRRTAANRMIERGVDLPTVQLAGHWKSPEMVLQIYSESDNPRVRAAVRAIAADRSTAGATKKVSPGRQQASAAAPSRREARHSRDTVRQKSKKSGAKR